MRRSLIPGLLRALLLIGVCSWGGVAHAKRPAQSLLTAATEAWHAVLACDRPVLEHAILTWEEVESYTTKAPKSEPEYQKLVDRWYETEVKQFCDAPKAGIRLRIDKPNIKDVFVVPAGGKVKREAVMAFVTVRVFVKAGNPIGSEGKESDRLMFLQHEGRWRILVKK